MNIKNLVAIAAVLVAGSAFADDTYPYVDHSKVVGTKSRAEVTAELAGASTARQTEYADQAVVATGKTRAEVTAELERDYAQGRYAATANPEFVEFTQVASRRSRDEVRQEAIQAARGTAVKGTTSGS